MGNAGSSSSNISGLRDDVQVQASGNNDSVFNAKSIVDNEIKTVPISVQTRTSDLTKDTTIASHNATGRPSRSITNFSVAMTEDLRCWVYKKDGSVGSEKLLTMNLYTGEITELDILTKMAKKSNMANMETKKTPDIASLILINKNLADGQCKYKFQTSADASLFERCVFTRNHFGSVITALFDDLDQKNRGRIEAIDLHRVMVCEGFIIGKDDIKSMLSLNDGNGMVMNYNCFFKLFLDVHVYTKCECLQEWVLRTVMTQGNDVSNRGDSKCGSLMIEDTFSSGLHHGEILINSLELCRWRINMGKSHDPAASASHPSSSTTSCSFQPIAGTVFVTNYRLVLAASGKAFHKIMRARFTIPEYFRCMSVPLCSINKIIIDQTRHGMKIHCKDCRVIQFFLPESYDSTNAKIDAYFSFLNGIAFPGSNSKEIFAFSLSTSFSSSPDLWRFGDLCSEYRRQGILRENNWRILQQSNYEISDSYPRFLALPLEEHFSNDDVMSVSKFRSKGRIPVIAFRCAKTGAVLTRSSQPMVGLAQKTSSFDELLLDLYRTKGVPRKSSESEEGSDQNKFYIMDARGLLAATANMAMGKGTEKETNYQNTELVFLNIENIHAMRNSLVQLADALLPGGYVEVGTHLSKIEESGWLSHARNLLSASVLGAEKLYLEGASILSHCSDGWDRTSQICSLIQIILDPYFRTIEGLAVLIEKDWCAFGHKFEDRCGHGNSSSYLPEERSPIFFQFLDVVYQVTNQFPSAFEYNENLLIFLADHAYSCMYGNFLGNSMMEREEIIKVKEKTLSMWSYVMDNFTVFKNDLYDNSSADPIWPSLSPKQMKIWNRYFNRWDPSCHPKVSNKKDENVHEDEKEDWNDSWLRHEKLRMQI